MRAVLTITPHFDEEGRQLYSLPTPPQPAQPLSPDEKILEILFKSWFHSPAVKDADSLLERTFLSGHVNEGPVLAALSGFLCEHIPGMLRGNIGAVKRYGLIACERGIVVSPDGIVNMRLPPDAVMSLHLVEIKTRITPNTVSVAHHHVQRYGAYVNCAFSSTVCKELLTIENRVQILHQVSHMLSRF